MGLFDFFKKKEEPTVKVEEQEVVDFSEQVSPTPTEHSNVVADGHDVFAKAMNDEEPKDVVEIEEKQEDIVPVEEEEKQEDLSSINISEVKINPNDMIIFKECLLAEVKRKKGTGELVTEEDVRNFCHERMVGFNQGTFEYPEDVRKSMRKFLENQDVINELSGKPRVLQPEEENIQKVA